MNAFWYLEKTKMSGKSIQRRAKSERNEQIPRQETIELRRKHVGPSCKLFFKQDPLKIVRAEGRYLHQ